MGVTGLTLAADSNSECFLHAGKRSCAQEAQSLFEARHEIAWSDVEAGASFVHPGPRCIKKTLCIG